MISPPSTFRNSNLISNSFTIAAQQLGSSPLAVDDNVKILFNNEPAATVTQKGVQLKVMQKSSQGGTTYTTSNTGHLDALASAALQASTGKHSALAFQSTFVSNSHSVSGSDNVHSNAVSKAVNRQNSVGNESSGEDVSLMWFLLGNSILTRDSFSRENQIRIIQTNGTPSESTRQRRRS